MNHRGSLFTFLPGILRPDWEGALRLCRGEGVLCPHPTERAPAAYVNRASSVSGTLLAFCVNQGRSSLFLSPFTFLITDAIILRESLDPTGAGPWYVGAHEKGEPTRSLQDENDGSVGKRTEGEVKGGRAEKTEKEKEIAILTHLLWMSIQAPDLVLPEWASEGANSLSTAHQGHQGLKPANCKSSVGLQHTGGTFTCTCISI